MRSFLAFLATCSLWILAPSTVHASISLTSTYLADGIEVTGSTPGGQVALLGIERQMIDSDLLGRTVPTCTVLADSSSTGSVQLSYASRSATPDSPMTNATWIAIDLTSGAVLETSPMLDPSPRSSASTRVVGLPNKAQGITIGLQTASVLVVRPGGHAWAARVGDGSVLDSGPEGDGEILVALADLDHVPVEGAPAFSLPASLSRLRLGDIVAFIDSQTLESRVLVVGEDLK